MHEIATSTPTATAACFRPGQPWLDRDGRPIEAHAGGVIHDGGRYYWYGMDFSGDTLPPNSLAMPQAYAWMRNRGVGIYVSDDLLTWERCGTALAAVEGDPGHPLRPEHWVIRPKAVRCHATGQYVMYGALTAPDWSCNTCVVATAPTAAGPFTYHGLVAPPHGAWDVGMFQDTDGTTWLTTGHNQIYLHRLSEDCLSIVETIQADGPEGEAQTIFQHDGTYYLIASRLWGWLPNPDTWWSAPSLRGPWTAGGEIATGPGATNTFSSQVTCVLPVAGRPGAFIFMSDRFNATTMYDVADFRQSTHVWLPLSVDAAHKQISVRWHDAWDLDQLPA